MDTSGFYVTRGGDGYGILLQMLGLVIIAAGLGLAYRSYIAYRQAYDIRSGKMSFYAMHVGLAVTVAGIFPFGSGLRHMIYWMEWYRNPTGVIRRYIGSGSEPARFMGLELEFSWARYQRAFEYGGVINLLLVGAALLGLYLAAGSLVSILRRDFDLVPLRIHMLTFFYGIGIFAVSAFFDFHWVTFVARSIF